MTLESKVVVNFFDSLVSLLCNECNDCTSFQLVSNAYVSTGFRSLQWELAARNREKTFHVRLHGKKNKGCTSSMRFKYGAEIT
jgi:hypothetical protein